MNDSQVKEEVQTAGVAVTSCLIN